MLEKVTYKDIFAFAWNYWKRRKTLGFWAIFFMLLATLVDVAFPNYVGKLVDSFTGSYQDNRDEALILIAIVLVLLLAFFLFRWLSWRVYNVYECFSMRDILMEALQKVQRFSTDWHSNNFSGGTVRKITRARTAFEMFEDTLILGFFPAIIIFFGISGMLILTLPSVGIFVFLTAILYCAVSVFISIKLLAPRYRISAKADTKVGAILADIISSSSTVKAFGAESREDEVFYETAEDWRRKTTYSYRFTNDMDMARNILNFVLLFGMLGMTFWSWQQGQATPGDITTVITSYLIIGGYLREIGRHVSNLQRAMSDMEDAVFFWKTDIAVKDRPDAGTMVRGKGEVVIDHITFAYKNQITPIYEDFSLTINPGEKVALVGHSGSGKTTFVKLLQRLYDIQGGQIRIDGQNIAEVTQSSLRQAIALVPQDPILFHRSLRDNIAYGCEGVSEDDIVRAARKAYAHDFIVGLPQGYDTLVGERGIKLSGGERQRVAIARAILADAPILILDEATSALDSVSEHYIQKALKALMEGRTTITIAHRLSTIKDVDRILVFDQGRIVEEGTHKSLLAGDTHYKELYEMQVLGLIA